MIDSDHGLVLRSIKLRETSKIVSIFCERHGRLRLVARGARDPKQRGAGNLEVGNHVEIVFSQQPGRDLGTLRESTLRHAWLAGARRLDVLGTGLAVVELLDRLVPEGAGEAALLGDALGCLEALQAAPDRAGAVLLFYAFELRLLERLGVKPELESCAGCGAASADTYHLEVAAGVLRCGRCASPGTRRLPLPREAVEGLAALAREEWQTLPRHLPAAVRRQIGLALHRLLGAHLELYRYPRSLQLLKNVDSGASDTARPGASENRSPAS